MGSPFDVFRRLRPIVVFGTSQLVDGVMTPGQVYHPEPVMASVQRIGRNTTALLIEQGKRPTDYRRIYSDKWLPMEGEAVINSAAETPDADDLVLPTGEVIHFFGKDNFARQPGVNDQSPPARMNIDGWWFAVETRVTMQNAIVPNYEYMLYRLPPDDQTV